MRLFVILFALSLLLFAYPAWRLGYWFHLSNLANALITVPLLFSQFIARFLLRNRPGLLAYVCRGFADLFLGLSPLLLILVIAGEIAVALLGWPSSKVATGILCSTAIAGLWGLRKAWRPEVVTVPLASPKLRKAVRFAQISDVHIGSRTSRFLRQVMHTVNAQNPDFLCITGDFVDQPGVTLEKLRPLTLFRGPIYYCTGNHERYEDLEDIVARLETLGVEVLRNRSVEVDGLQFIGIDDHDSPKQVGRVLPLLQVREDLYSILLYHRPQGLADAQRHGIDLKLSGHTHAGQIVPFHLAVNKVFEYRKGLYQLQDTYLYVNEGTGTWGPTLRLGTRSEITVFELSPA